MTDTGTAATIEDDDAPIPVAELSGNPLRDLARQQLPHLCAAYRQNQDQIDALEKVNKSLMTQIKPIAEAAALTKVNGEGWNLRRSGGGRTDIDGTKLLEHGVSVDVIEAATVRKSWTFYTVLRPAQPKDGTKTKGDGQ